MLYIHNITDPNVSFHSLGDFYAWVQLIYEVWNDYLHNDKSFEYR